MNRQISHRCAGTSFSNINERGGYESIKNARVTLNEALIWSRNGLLTFIIKQRHSIARVIHQTSYGEGLPLWFQGCLKVEMLLI